MNAARISAEALRTQITTAEKQLNELKDQLAGLEAPDKAENQPPQPREDGQPRDLGSGESTMWPLTQEEYNRYGRQMIVPSIGIQGLSCKF
jgi:adenylyltransferase and sulfurtransferase